MDTNASLHYDLSLKQKLENFLQQRRAQWPKSKQTQSQDQSANPNAAPLQKPLASQKAAETKMIRPGKVWPVFQLVDKEHLLRTVPDFTRQMYAMAAFCNFRDKREFHRLQFSPPFLEAYRMWLDYSKGHKEYLSLIADEDGELLKEERLDAETYPTSFSEISKKYPLDESVEAPTRSMNRLFGLASVLLVVSRNLRKYPSYPDDKKLEFDKKARASFDRVINREFPTHFKPSEVKECDVGPFKKETSLDRIQRINYIFYSIKSLASPSKWKDNHLSDPELCKLFDEPAPVHPEWSPAWLLPEEVDIEKEETPRGPLPKNFIMQFLRDRGTVAEKAEMEEHIRELKDEVLEPPPDESRLKIDPRYCTSGTQWRDCLRREFKMEEIGLDIRTIYAQVVGGKKEYLFGERQGHLGWSAVKKLCETSEVQFQMVLKVLPKGAKPAWEWRGLPPELQGYMKQGDDNVISLTSQTVPEISKNAAVDHAPEDGGVGGEKQRLQQIRDAKKKHIEQGHAVVIPVRGKTKQTWIDYHDGFDVNTPEGLAGFQRLVFDDPLICDFWQPLDQDGLNADLGGIKLTKDQRAFLDENDLTQRQKGLQEDNDGLEDVGTTLPKPSILGKVQDAFTGAHGSTGPPVEISRLVLGMEDAGYFKDTTNIPVFTCSLLPKCQVKFLDTQITGAVWILQRLLGFVPRYPGLDDQNHNEARLRLRSVPIGSAIYADMTGLGKTLTTCLALSLLLKAIDEGQVALRSNEYMPSFCFAPSAVVLKQWHKTLKDNFPELSVLVSATVPQSWVIARERLGTAAMKYPDSKFPSYLKYVLDKTDKRAIFTVILTLPDTHSSRTMHAPGEQFKSPKQKGKSKKGTKRGQGGPKKQRMRKNFSSFLSVWANRSLVVIFDEAHKLRHINTKLYHSILKMNPKYSVFLSASPMVNEARDILGPLQLMWLRVLETIRSNQISSDWFDAHEGGWDLIPKAGKLPKTNKARLACIQPRAVDQLLKTEQVALIQENFKYVSEMVLLRRSTGSKLKLRVGSDDVLDLSQMMQPHVVKTVDLKYRESEKAESQFWHLLAATSYDAAIQGSIPQKADNPQVDNKSFPAITGPLRKLAIAAASTKLARLDRELEACGYSSLVEDMDGYRSLNHDLTWMVGLVHQPTEGARPTTRLGEIRYMLEGSPLGRFLFGKVKDCLDDTSNSKKKILCIEDIPLSGWNWETLLKAVYVDVKVLYSSTSTTERQKAVDDFNDPNSSLKVLVLLYNVGGAQGTNLDKSCNQAIVLMPAINSMLEIQAWGRIIRVSQSDTAWILRPKVRNTHMQWRDSRQMDKSMVELACRTGIHPEVEDLLLTLLKKYHFEVLRAHEKVDEEPQPEISGPSTPKKRLESPTTPSNDDGYDNEEEDDAEDADYEYDSDFESSDSSSDEDSDDDYEEVYDKERTFLAAKNAYRGLSLQDKQTFDHERLNVELLLKFDPKLKYTRENLREEYIFERALTLLYRERYGIKNLDIRVGPHVKYSKLSKAIVDAHKKVNMHSRNELIKKAKQAKLDPKKIPGKKSKKRPSESDIAFYENPNKKGKSEEATKEEGVLDELMSGTTLGDVAAPGANGDGMDVGTGGNEDEKWGFWD